MTRLKEARKTGKKKIKIGWVVLGALALCGIAYGIVQTNLYGAEPTLTVLSEGKPVTLPFTVGKNATLEFAVANVKGGICGVTATLSQGGRDVIVLDERDLSTSAKKFEGTLLSSPKDLSGFSEGPVRLVAVVKSCALFARKTLLTLDGQMDVSPPQVHLTSSQHYVNLGGADVATYTTSQDAVISGVRVGPYEFKGYPKSVGGNEHFVFFVYAYDVPPGTPMILFARDAAGNESTSTFSPTRFFPKEFRKRDLPVDDNFINTKIADIIANTPEIKRTGDPVTDYLAVNRDLRKKNAAFLVELSKKSEPVFFWKDAFKPLMNAAVEANFADYRSYIYNGQKVDEQVHLGFDLAAVERYPIQAGNRGKIVFSGYLGIYGNTVIIDHGYGLMTLYGHLSTMDVSEGQMVEAGEKIGNSGATGLAGGDHLHFSMLIQGVQTNPVEFWDQHWIDDHVYLRVSKDHFGK
jgi:hypothetical protein